MLLAKVLSSYFVDHRHNIISTTQDFTLFFTFIYSFQGDKL